LWRAAQDFNGENSTKNAFVLKDHLDTSFPWPYVQIAGVSSLDEALLCAGVGATALGFTLALPSGVHDGLTTAKAAKIIKRLPSGILPVVITYLREADSASDLANQVGAEAVQFHGGLPESQLLRFRRLCPGLKTIGLVTVKDESSIQTAASLSPPLWDAIILDSFHPETGRTGATGLTHDWAVSAAIVRKSPLPVILAGGLNPGNVADAIATVRPYGVDAHTGLENPDGARNFDKIRAFITASRAALRRLSPRNTPHSSCNGPH